MEKLLPSKSERVSGGFNPDEMRRSRRNRRRFFCVILSFTLAALPMLAEPPGVQPRLVLSTGGGPLQVQLHGLQANQLYQIKASTNLHTWTTIGQRAAVNGTLSVTDPQAGRLSRRYYQAVAPVSSVAQGRDAYAPDRILVKPKPGVSLSSMHLSLGATVLNVFPAIGNLQVVKVPPASTADGLVALYRQSGLVQYAEPDYYVQALGAPNDPFYSNLWGFHNTGQFGGVTNADIDAPDAWNVQSDAGNIIVAVVDTGVRYTHLDLAPNIWVNPVDGSHGTNVVADGRPANDPFDDFGHGTHCAGIIGAVGNNSVGVAGVAWKVQIMACKFLDTNGVGTVDGAVACLDFARTHGANVVNASWGATAFTSQALHDAVASLGNAGIMFVAAAGNSSADNDVQPLYPASYSDLDNVISVAASDESDNLASFSDYGATNVDLAAPGALIYSCWSSSDNDYQYLDGTSMACAMVSGAVAVMEAHFPGWSYQQIKQQMLATVDTRPGLQGRCISGGRLNLYRALAGGVPPPALAASFSANPYSGPAPLAVQLTDTSTGNPVSWNWNFGDGSASTLQNPSHTFNLAGSFTVSLTVADASGHTNSASQTITATSATNAAPVLTLDATQPDAYVDGQVSGGINFHRTGDTSQAYQVYWSFSGTASNGVDFGPLPTNSPFPAGQSDATLAITPINHGQTNDETVVVTLMPGSAYQIGTSNSAIVIIHGLKPQPGPVAGFTANPTAGQAPLAVSFTDQSTGPVTSWNWTFGDGATSTSQNPSHTYSSAGSYTATLTVGGSGGQTSSASHVITVTNAAQPVGAAFAASPTTGQAPLAVSFTDQSTGPVTSWNWAFGDGATSTSQNPSHTYSSAGNYTATLTVGGSGGQTSSASHAITVTNAAQPVGAAFTANPTAGHAPLAVSFTDQSSGPIVSWNWAFGDGATSTSQNPSHTYSSAGSYTATLTVGGSGGQTSSASQVIAVTNAPPPPAPTVTVATSQFLATSVTPGIFSITRSGSTALPLAVNYTLGGTARNGVTYQTLPGTVTIPAGSATATVAVNPIGLLNVLQTVILTVSSGAAYNAGVPGSATVEIVASLGL